MPHKVSLGRKIVYFLALVFFIISSVIVTFFAFGYRFNFQHGIFIYSGTITIKSTPKDVNIYLNGKPADQKTYDLINGSYNLNGIKPGSYLLEIKTPGYSSWKKQIAVHSGVATEFWNVILTQDQAEKNRLDIVDPDYYKISSNAEKIAFSNRQNGTLSIFIHSPKKQSSFQIFQETPNKAHAASLEFFEFSPDQQIAVFSIKEEDSTQSYLADLNQIEKQGINDSTLIPLNPSLKKLLDNPKNPPFKTSSFKWLDSKNIFFLNNNSLYLYALDKQELKLIHENIRGYEISQNSLFYVQAPNNLVFKSDYNGQNTKQITENLIDQDLSSDNDPWYKIIIYDDKRIALINQNHELYLYNDNDKEYQIFKKISPDATNAQFSDDGKKLLYFNDYQIKVYYLREWEVQPKNDVGSNVTIYQNKKEKIFNALWFKNYQNILFSQSQSINLVEIDLRDKINQSVVIKNNISNPQFSYNIQNDSIFFLELSDKYVQLFTTKFPPK
ncbi:MAG: PEGA domain-containing protein [Patescibacteria group bacterium]|nr:PEGA domain-containing protein [Patescibacteria group bacterium]